MTRFEDGHRRMRIVDRPPGAIQPYPANPRRIPDAAVEAVAASISHFGFRQPIVVDRAGVIIAGHVRHAAAVRLGLATVPVLVADDLTDAQARALRLADNRLAEMTDWQPAALLGEMTALDDAGFPEMDALGLDARFRGQFSIDDVPPAPAASPAPASKTTTCPKCGHEW